MCGIAGILELRGGTPPTDLVRRMNALQAHRGPDGEGLLELGPLALGHRRLAVFDLSERAAQPMRLAEAELAISYNGEVYNHPELRAELEAAGERFRTTSDTEVVLRAYARWGEGALERLNGMFAFALWDGARRRLLLARDRLGIKPLYLWQDAGRLVFASELKALLAAAPAARALEPAVLARFLQRGVQDDGPETFFRGARQLAPAHLLTVELEGERARVRERRYWSLEDVIPAAAAQGDPAPALRALLDDAVALQLRSDVPVGTCLSGGLDSSAVVALASGRASAPVRTFTAVYDDPGYDERRFARAVVRHFGCEAHEVSPRPGRALVPLLDLIGWYHDEPCSRPGLVTQWYVMAAAAGRVTVLLDGQGGDELLLGYASYALPYLRSLGAAALRERAPEQALKLWRDGRGLLAQRSTSAYGPGTLLRHVAVASWRRLGRAGPALAPELAAAAAARGGGARAGSSLAPIDRALRDDVTALSLPALLHHEDRASMAFSLEARVPFLDHRLVELCLGLDFRTKVEGGAMKSVLRRALADLLPSEVLTREDKLGYPTPIDRWLREAGTEVHEVLLDGFAERGLVRARDVERQVAAFARGEARADPWLLFRWLTAELWLARFVDRPPAPPLVPPGLDLPAPRRG